MKRFFGYRSFEPEFGTMRKMRDIGIDNITVMVSNYCNFMGEPYTRYQPVWVWEGQYDFALLDHNIQDHLDAVPDAKLTCALDLNPPAWWYRRGDFNWRFDPFYEFGRVASSPEYRNDVCDYLEKILKYLVDKFSSNIIAIVLMGGKTTEWFDDSRGAESMPRIEAFNRYMAQKGLMDKVDIPPYFRRYSGAAESGGLLRTPEKHGMELDYWRFNSMQSAETMELFISTARSVLPETMALGLWYGYIFELGLFQQASWSQLEYERILNNPSVDFVLNPFSYGIRNRSMGGSPVSMIPLVSAPLRGKNLIMECDDTTFTSRFPAAPGGGRVSIMGRHVEWPTPGAVSAGLKRATSYALIYNTSIWFFDMWGGWYDNPAAQSTLKRCKQIWDMECGFTPGSAAEVMVVADPENMYYINDSNPESLNFLRPIIGLLNQSGVPYLTAGFNDLDKFDTGKIKLFIFCHPFEIDPVRQAVMRRVLPGKTACYLYPPGIIHNGRWDPEHVECICGSSFDTSQIVVRTTGDWRSVAAFHPENMRTGDLRKVMEIAQVHIWSGEGIPIYANDRLFAFHCAGIREVKISLPRESFCLEEVFSGRKLGAGKEFHIEVNDPDTLLFRY